MIVRVCVKDREFNPIGESEGFRNPAPLLMKGASEETLNWLGQCFIWKRLVLWQIGEESEFHAWISGIQFMLPDGPLALTLEVEQL